MTSSPLRQFFPTLIGFLILGFLLYRMLTPGGEVIADTKPSVSETNTEEIPCVLSIRSAHPAESIKISLNGKIIWAAQHPALLEETEIAIPLNKKNITLDVVASWPERTTDTPITLDLEPEGQLSRSVTRWSFGNTLLDTFTFSWK